MIRFCLEDCKIQRIIWCKYVLIVDVFSVKGLRNGGKFNEGSGQDIPSGAIRVAKEI